MPKFKKNTSAFKMKGYSYAGTSPMRNLKDDPSQMDNPESSYHDAGKHQEIQGKTETNLNANIAAINKSKTDEKKGFWQKTGKFLGDLGSEALEHGVKAGVSAGVAAMFATPPKGERQSGGKFTGNIGSTSKLV